MKIALTGASGYLGQAFIRVYRKLYLVPISFDLQKREYFSLNNRSVLNIEQFLEPVEALIHLGSFMPKNIKQAQDKDSSKKNMEPIITLLTYKLPGSKYIVYISTIDVYVLTHKVSEKAESNPNTEYAISKLACENIVKQFAEKHGILFSILRVGTVYGPEENSFQKVITVMLRDFIMNNQITIYGDGSIRRNFLYVEDVAKMIGEVAFASKQNWIINLIGFHPNNIRELVNKIQLLVQENRAILKELNLTVPISDHNLDTTLLNSIFPNFKFTPIINGRYNELKFNKSGIS